MDVRSGRTIVSTNCTFSFKDQNVIVTGGTRGIGKAISEAFLGAGARVCATYASNDNAASVFKEGLGNGGANLTLKKFNVASYSEVESFFKEYETEVGVPHVVVNNSGIRRDAILAMMSEDDWSSVIDTNLSGTFNMSKFAVKQMIGSRYGRIINITSPIGKYGMSGQTNYGASKAGQVGFTRCLAKEVAKRKITVNCVSPGFIETELLANLPEELMKKYKEQVPMRRFGSVAEVASAVLFLASEEASYVTGATLEVAGGF